MPTFIHQPNDKLFKKAMADIRVAREFFATHLPPVILEQADLETLKFEKHSFIDEAYKGSEADVVYSVKIGNSQGYFYLLCENQSTIDFHIAFRLLLYTVRLLETHVKQHPKNPLPLVYPLVLYTGQKTWDAPRDIMDLFGEQKELAKQILFQPYALIEVQQEKDEDLRRHLWSGMVEFALKYRHARNFAQFLETLLPWLNEIEIQQGSNFARIVLRYVIDGIEKGNEQVFIKKSNEFLSSRLRGEVMTIAQQIEQRGIEQGLHQGIQQGLVEGESTLLVRQLNRKFGTVPAQYLAYIKQADPETLLRWGERILEAKTLKEMFQEE